MSVITKIPRIPIEEGVDDAQDPLNFTAQLVWSDGSCNLIYETKIRWTRNDPEEMIKRSRFDQMVLSEATSVMKSQGEEHVSNFAFFALRS